LKTYVVGGAVRDELLGLPVVDRDWVVVGATPEDLSAAGFTPVGRDFPVFLHPRTHEEYALARTERKSGRGYRGFTVHASPEVTLEEDLARRDLTINAMARDEAGRLIDPYHGERDLREGVLRHVGPAFEDDPVRILRVARFAARYGFRVAEETMALLQAMVAGGEADHLVAERVWQEIARGLGEARPVLMFEVLDRAGLLAKLLPEIVLDDWLRNALARAVDAGATLAERFVVTAWRVDEAAARLICARLKIPNDTGDLAVLAVRNAAGLRAAHAAAAGALLAILKHADAFRRRERFSSLLAAAQIAEPGDPMQRGSARLLQALAAADAVDAGAIARDSTAGGEIAERIDRAREAAIAAAVA